MQMCLYIYDTYKLKTMRKVFLKYNLYVSNLLIYFHYYKLSFI